MVEARRHAVVIGAGIGGLAAAGALADRFGRVTVVDRDQLPDTAVPRPNVPQGAHAHAILASGLHALEELFPGLSAELVERGAIEIDAGRDIAIHRGGLWTPFANGIMTLCFSRPLLELRLRERLAALPTVTVRGGAPVAGLIGDGGRVVGVRLADGELGADLVVDASGRAGACERWLGALGLPVPDVESVRIGIAYASRLLRRDPADPGGRTAFLTVPVPPERRVAAAFPIEGDRWMISAGGWHGDHASGDPDGFLQFVKDLPDDRIYRILDSNEPLTDVAIHQYPNSRRRYFEKLADVPAGYVATGDALCSFNPVYGQGMTCAAMHAVELGRALDRHDGVTGALSREFYRRAGRVTTTPWRFAVGGDFAYPQTEGPKPAGTDLFNRYVERLQRAAMRSGAVRKVMAEIQHLLVPPHAVFRPSMIAAALRQGRR